MPSPVLANRPLYGVLCALALQAALTSPVAAQVLHDPRLAHDTLYQGAGMVALAFAPGGRLYVCEKRGRVLSFAPDGKGGYARPSVFLDLRREVTVEIESGVLGLALDPAFATNRQLYLFYTRADGSRIVRVTANAALDAVEPGSERVLLSELPHQVAFHKGGQLAFAPGVPEALYVGLGDDERPEAAQDADRYEGKILRVNKADGRGLPDNPFCRGERDLDSVRCKVWARGLRNPFRFVFPSSGTPKDVLYLAENGDFTDRVSRVKRGSNGGWSPQREAGDFRAPADKGHRVLLTETGSVASLLLVEGGAFSEAPSARTLFVANGASGTIQRYRLTGPALDQLEPLDLGLAFLSGLTFAGAVDMVLGPDGALYYVHSSVDASDQAPYLLGRVRVVGVAQLTDRSAELAASSTASARSTANGTAGTDRTCDDLSAIPVWPDVVYETQVQSIWTTQCVGCHGGAAGLGAGLDLRAGSLSRLRAASSVYLPGRRLLVAGAPARSYLFEKLNCASPEHGMRMRPGAALTREKQAIVRDWIAQIGQPPKPKPFHIRYRYLAAGALALLGVGYAWRRRRQRSG